MKLWPFFESRGAEIDQIALYIESNGLQAKKNEWTHVMVRAERV
jgi:hypothetical protein